HVRWPCHKRIIAIARTAAYSRNPNFWRHFDRRCRATLPPATRQMGTAGSSQLPGNGRRVRQLETKRLRTVLDMLAATSAQKAEEDDNGSESMAATEGIGTSLST